MGAYPSAAIALRDLASRTPDALATFNAQQKTQQEQQEEQQKVEGGQLDLTAKKRALADQQTIMDTLKETNGDVGQALPKLAGKVTPQAFQGLANFHLETRKTLSQIADNDLKVQQDQHDRTSQLYDYASKLPDDQYAQQWPTIAQRNNEINPQHPLDPNNPIPKAQFPSLGVGLQTQEQYLKAETERREQAAATETKRHNLASEQNVADKPETRTVVTGKGVFQYNPETNKFDKYIGPAPATAQFGNFGQAGDPMIDMVGQGRVDLATALQRVAPAAKQSFMKQLSAKYPDFNQATYGVEKAVTKDFTSGKSAQNLTAFNTAIEHAGQLDKAVDALKNGDVRGLNSIGNTLGYQFGSDATTNFNVIKNALSGEISKVFKGGQATDAEIQHVQQPFDAANSPAQLKGAIKQAIALMNSKRDALKQQYEAGKKAQPNFGGNQGGETKQGGDFWSQFPEHK